jgi:16S rRNA processing protein RimM
VAVGWVRAPHGIRGELKVSPLSDHPTRFIPGSDVWAGGKRYTIYDARPHRDALLVELRGVRTRNEAEAFRNQLLEIPEGDLPELEPDTYYRFQVVGMEVIDVAGTPLGTVREVLHTGANDVYVVVSDDGELLVPALDTVVREVDIDAQRMVVELIEGLERKPPSKAKRQSRGKAGTGDSP